jgi:hypothetical protein
MKKVTYSIIRYTLFLPVARRGWKPKVIYDAANKANENRFDPSYLLHFIQMEGTNYLIHPTADLVSMKEVQIKVWINDRLKFYYF